MISAEHLADAYELIAKANHYLVGVVARDGISHAEYDAAEQILITRQNTNLERSTAWRRLDLALEILAYDRKRLGY